MKPTPIIFTVTRCGDLFYAITSVAIPHGDPPPLHVSGTPGQHLYVALAGHRWATHPQTASTLLAAQSRAYIQGWSSQSVEQLMLWHPSVAQAVAEEQQYNLANRVVQHWGDFIQPWLGMRMIDKFGQPIENHPHYSDLIHFPQPELWSVFNVASN